MKIKESVITWRPMSEAVMDGRDYLCIGGDGIISSNRIAHDALGFAYRSDIKHYVHDKRQVDTKLHTDSELNQTH